MNWYHLLSRRNDLNALIKGHLAKRIVRRVIYKHAFRAAGWLSRLVGVGR